MPQDEHRMDDGLIGTPGGDRTPERPDVAALLERVQQGDRESFMTLIGLYQQKVFVMAYSIVRNREDALDIVQETFLRLYQKAGLYRPGGNVQGWILRIAKNLSIDHHRKHSRKKKEWEVSRSVDELPLSSGNPDEAERVSDLRSVFSRCVEKLAKRQKTVFVMRHYNELQFNEISEALRISVGTAKSLHFKAVQNLRKWLIPYLGINP